MLPPGTADVPMEKYPLVQRHSIVDLSASNLLLKQDVPSCDKLQTRRVVASKRRPSASTKQPRNKTICSSPQTDCFTKDEKNPFVSIKYVMFREHQERSCAVYEPLVTHKTFHSIRPLFDRCINFLEDQQNNVKLSLINTKRVSTTDSVKDDDPHSPNLTASSDCLSKELTFDVVLSNLKNLSREYYEKLKQLEILDTTIMRLVRAIELEHMRLYDFQLNMSMLKKQTKEESDQSGSSPSPWPTQLLDRLETLEEAKKQLQELESSGMDICESIDNLIKSNLYQVIGIMECLSSDSNTANSAYFETSWWKRPDSDSTPRADNKGQSVPSTPDEDTSDRSNKTVNNTSNIPSTPPDHCSVQNTKLTPHLLTTVTTTPSLASASLSHSPDPPAFEFSPQHLKKKETLI